MAGSAFRNVPPEDAGDARRTPTFPPQTDASTNTIQMQVEIQIQIQLQPQMLKHIQTKEGSNFNPTRGEKHLHWVL